MPATSKFCIVTPPAEPYRESSQALNAKAPVPLFRAYNHPLAPSSAKRVFIMFMDTTMAGMKKSLELEKGLKIPYAHLDNLEASGM
jgi:hypothetical protein